MAAPGTLEKPHVRVRLIRALAVGEHSQGELARRHGVSPSAMSQFVKRHAERIAEVAEKLDDQFAGIAYADKVARVEMLSDQIITVLEVMADPEKAAKAGVQMAEMLGTAQRAARAIADERGQIPARVQVEHSGSLDVQLNGVDIGALT